MAVEELTDIMEYDEALYFGINDEIVLGGVITEMTESSNPTESEKQYIHQKSKTKKRKDKLKIQKTSNKQN